MNIKPTISCIMAKMSIRAGINNNKAIKYAKIENLGKVTAT